MKVVIAVLVFVLFVFISWLLELYPAYLFGGAGSSKVESSATYSCTPSRFQSNAAFRQAADQLLNDHIKDGSILGGSTGVYKAGCGYYQSAAGYSSKKEPAVFSLQTTSRTASLSKPMTAIAIMQLYEQGLIELDLPISNYLPNLNNDYSEHITVRQLLSHTAGVPHYESTLDAMSFTHYETLTDAVNEITKRSLVSAPGSEFIYSSYGYTLLGAIVESVSGKHFEKYMREHIWLKSGMLNTSLDRRENSVNASEIYMQVGPVYIRSPETDLSIIYPAGGMQTTVFDLLKFGEAILNNVLVSKEALMEMADVRHSLASASGNDAYGLGWVVHHYADLGTIISHSGAQPGASTYLRIYLDKKLVVATMSNAYGTKDAVFHLSDGLANMTW